MYPFGLSGLCGAPAASAFGASHNSQRTQTCTFKGPGFWAPQSGPPLFVGLGKYVPHFYHVARLFFFVHFKLFLFLVIFFEIFTVFVFVGFFCRGGL